MTEQKRRGRPPKRERLDVEADIGTLDRPPYVAAWPEVALIRAEMRRGVELAAIGASAINPAQAYADRVWAGQSPSALRSWRVERVKAALEGQNLPFDGVELPE